MPPSQPSVVTDQTWPTISQRVFHAPVVLQLWFFICSLFAVDLAWGTWSGLSVSGLSRVAVAIIMLLALSFAYLQRSRILADMAQMAALWIGVSSSGCILTYLATTCALPLQDAMLIHYDRAIGFDWLVWHDAVARHSFIHLVLSWAYDSLMVQILVACLLLPALRLTSRCANLILLAVVTLIFTTLIYALCPVLGPRAVYSVDDLGYVAHVQALRMSGPWSFDLSDMLGIVTMPSYHTVLAILFTYSYRRTGIIGWGVAGANGIMLVSIPSIGGHYLMDMAVGSAIAVLCIFAMGTLDHLRRYDDRIAVA